MTRKTVNLSRARAASRQKRANRAVKILREKLENQEGEDVTLAREVNQEIWERGAKKPPTKITVDVQSTEEGVTAFQAEQPTTEKSTTESSKSSESVDYEEVVEGTVAEVKEEVEEEDLDPEKVLEAEKEKKDRKTLKQFLQDLI